MYMITEHGEISERTLHKKVADTMSSRDNDKTTPHQPLLSSLVVRPSDSPGGGSDYEPGEVRRDPPSYSRSDRFPDNSHGSLYRFITFALIIVLSYVNLINYKFRSAFNFMCVNICMYVCMYCV